MSSGFTNGSAVDLKPVWLTDALIANAVEAHIDKNDFVGIHRISYDNAISTTENYVSNLVRINVEVVLKDSNKRISFILKTPPINLASPNPIELLQFFEKEEEIYHSILPKFEALYRDVGHTEQFAPKPYRFEKSVTAPYILLQNLRDRDYKHANRLKGLDLEHMRHALKKLAAFHAASACYIEKFQPYSEKFNASFYKGDNRDLLSQLMDTSKFLVELKKWPQGIEYYKKLSQYSTTEMVDILLDNQKPNLREFNVLNHSDCWTNNILFQYDAFGNIKDTKFIDFAAAKYGSPTIDLYFLIFTSAAADIVLSQFDYMIRFYYDQLIENLIMLEYHRPLPKLKNLHVALLQNGITAYIVVAKVLPAVLWDVQNNGSVVDMYSNIKYKQTIAEIIPWLDNRGMLNWK